MRFKRLLCLITALLMLLTCGCNGGNDESSDAGSAGGESSEVSKKEKEYGPTEYTQKIDAMLSGNGDRSLFKKNLLKGLSYKTSVDASSDYPDGSKKLTDGKVSDTFDKENWVGYNSGSGAVNIISFDLGSVQSGLMDFTVTILDHADYGINPPITIKVYVAVEEGEYTRIGTAFRSDGANGQNAALKYSVMLQGGVEARYIRFDVSASGGWLFLGEIAAYAYNEDYTASDDETAGINEYYGYNGIPEVTEPEYWGEGESDYNTEVNLISQKKPYISAGDVVETDYLTAWYNGTDTQKLTDGKNAAEPSYADDKWFHITSGYTRTIVYDLEKTSAVSRFVIGLLQDSSAGVNMPTDLAFRVSENGKEWQTLHISETVSANGKNDIVRHEVALDKAHKARYVRIDFYVYSHTFIDEISVFGTKNASNAADVDPDEEGESVKGGYLMPEDFFGVNNMLLSYHCLLDESLVAGDNGRVDVDEYLPYLAYLDKDGNVKDTFFDSVLYLPYVNMLHDPVRSVFGRSADGWRNYVDDMFYPDRNMNALDKCAGEVYSELGVTDEKIKVFTSILYTFPTLQDGSKNEFGDIDGDGRNEDFSKISDRKKAIKWIMDEEYRRFNEGNYENLEFCGFYWFEETIDYNDPHEKELIRFAVDYAHTLDCKVFWIPYRTAMGVNDWKELGFDAACLQPNYMFNENGTISTIYNTADRASNLGMCVELELSGPQYPSAQKKFIEYLNVGAETGFMKAVKMYYQDGVPGAFYDACYSTDASVRRIYDYTYQFAKEKYEPIRSDNNVISDEPLSFTYKANKNLREQLDISGLDMSFGRLVITLSPKYGEVKLNQNGSFIYYPADDFNGEDHFEIAYDVGHGELVSTRITVTCEG